MDDLKPCPHCNSKDVKDYYVCIKCIKCGLSGPHTNNGCYDSHADFIDHKNAIKLWNNLTRNHGVDDKDLRDKIGALTHEQWSGWMKYLFSKCHKIGDKIIIPDWAIKRWNRQIDTPYFELTEEEKESDRIEADKFIEALKL